MPPDWQLSVWLTSLAGDYPALDELMKVIASNYFAPRVSALIVLFLWFGTRDSVRREHTQKVIVCVAAAMLLGFLTAELISLIQFHCGDLWARPYDNHPEARKAMELLYFTLPDSSFPSAAMCGLAAVAAGLWCVDRRASALVWILVGLWGFGRIYVGIHYPIDVAGGMLIGVLSAFVGLKLTQAADPAVSSLVRLGKRVYIA